MQINKLKTFFIGYVLIFFCCSNITYSKDSSHIEHKEWRHLNQTLFESSYSKSQAPKNRLITLLGSFGLTCAFWCSCLITNGGIVFTPGFPGVFGNGVWVKNDQKPAIFCDTTKFKIPTLISLPFFIYSYIKMKNWVIANEEQKTLLSFIQNWEQNKKLTPAKLHTLLDTVYIQYKEKPDQVDIAEITRIIKAFVNYHRKNNNARLS